MIYPYTIVQSKDIDFIYNFLKENGFGFNSFYDVNYYKEFNCVYCVIDDGGIFGYFCFYVSREQLDEARKRIFVNNQKFIYKIYELLNIDES